VEAFAYAERQRGGAVVEAVQADRLAAGVVVQPNTFAEQDRSDVCIDLVRMS
jgi:hypothetical protein